MHYDQIHQEMLIGLGMSDEQLQAEIDQAERILSHESEETRNAITTMAEYQAWLRTQV